MTWDPRQNCPIGQPTSKKCFLGPDQFGPCHKSKEKLGEIRSLLVTLRGTLWVQIFFTYIKSYMSYNLCSINFFVWSLLLGAPLLIEVGGDQEPPGNTSRYPMGSKKFLLILNHIFSFSQGKPPSSQCYQDKSHELPQGEAQTAQFFLWRSSNRKCQRVQILGVSLITTAVMDKPPQKDDFQSTCQNRIHVCQSAFTWHTFRYGSKFVQDLLFRS